MNDRFIFTIVRKSDMVQVAKIMGDYTKPSLIVKELTDIHDREGRMICTVNTMIYTIERRFVNGVEDVVQDVEPKV